MKSLDLTHWFIAFQQSTMMGILSGYLLLVNKRETNYLNDWCDIFLLILGKIISDLSSHSQVMDNLKKMLMVYIILQNCLKKSSKRPLP